MKITRRNAVLCVVWLVVRMRAGGVQVRVVVPRMRPVASACALIPTKRQYILEHNFWGCGQNTSHSISKWENT